MADFKQAVEWIKEGKEIRRVRWNSEIRMSGEGHRFYIFDFEATDWEIYEEKKESLSDYIHSTNGDFSMLHLCNIGAQDVAGAVKRLKDKINDCLEHQGECKCGNDHSVNLHFMEAIDEVFGGKLT